MAPARTARKPLIGATGRRALRSYRYNAEDLSLLAPYFQRFWNGVCARLPAWLAPNCVTVGGLLLVVLSAALCWETSPRLDAHLPAAALLLHAALLFGYQTLDAVDGKQARRTGSSGPLGAFSRSPHGGRASHRAVTHAFSPVLASLRRAV